MIKAATSQRDHDQLASPPAISSENDPCSFARIKFCAHKLPTVYTFYSPAWTLYSTDGTRLRNNHSDKLVRM